MYGKISGRAQKSRIVWNSRFELYEKLMYCLYAVQSEKRSENGNLDSERLSWKTALVLAASENTYGDTGVFCAISRAKNIYACGMELDKYITKIKAGKMYKYMQTRELFSRGEKHEKQDVTYGG